MVMAISGRSHRTQSTVSLVVAQAMITIDWKERYEYLDKGRSPMDPLA